MHHTLEKASYPQKNAVAAKIFLLIKSIAYLLLAGILSARPETRVALPSLWITCVFQWGKLCNDGHRAHECSLLKATGIALEQRQLPASEAMSKPGKFGCLAIESMAPFL